MCDAVNAFMQQQLYRACELWREMARGMTSSQDGLVRWEDADSGKALGKWRHVAMQMSKQQTRLLNATESALVSGPGVRG